MITKQLVQDVGEVVRIDIQQFFEDFFSFDDNDRTNITQYYSGGTTQPNSESFNNLFDLQLRAQEILNALRTQKNSFTTFAEHELLSDIEDIETKLSTIENTSKYVRSSISRNNFNPNVGVDIIQRQNETLEQISRQQLSSIDEQNDWMQLAIDNNLIEEDYSGQGGALLKAVLRNNSSFFVNAVVDNINGINVYGLDIDQKLQFVDNDLKVLSYVETLKQSVLIKAQLLKGDSPEFPNDGINRAIIGSNIGSIAFPTLFRNLSDVFSKDDTLSNFSITDVRRVKDQLILQFTVGTRLQEVYSFTASI